MGMRARESLGMFLLLAITYGGFFQASTWGAAGRFDLTRALVERGTIRIDAYHENTGDKALLDGRYYCDKAPLPSFLAVPGVALAHGIRAATGLPASQQVWLALAGGLATLFATGLVTAAGGALFLLALRDRGFSAPVAWMATFFVFVGTLLFPYGTVLQGHAPAAAWLIALFHFAFPATGPPGARRSALAGFAASGALATEYLTGPAIALLAGVSLLQHRAVAGRHLLGMVAGAAPGLVLLGAYHTAAFGGPFTVGYQHVALPVYQERMKAGLLGISWPDPAVAARLLVGPFRGLLFACPILLVAPLGLARLAREPARRLEIVAAALVFLYYWLLNAGYSTWWGGWAIGPRHLVPTIPLVGIGVGAALVRWPRAVCGIGAVSVLFMLAATAVQPEVPDEIGNPLFEHLLPRLVRGELSVAEQGFGDLFPRRLDPATPDRWDAFHVGEALGLPGPAALLPLIVLWGIAAWRVSVRCRPSVRGAGGSRRPEGQP